MEIDMESIQKQKQNLKTQPYDTTTLLLGIYLKESKLCSIAVQAYLWLLLHSSQSPGNKTRQKVCQQMILSNVLNVHVESF